MIPRFLTGFRNLLNRIPWGIRFFFYIYVIELALMLILFSSVRENNRFQGIYSASSLQFTLFSMWFLFRVGLLHLLFGAILEWVLVFWKVSKPRSVSFFFFFIVLVHLAIRHPQIFDEFDFVSRLLVYLKLYNYIYIQDVLVFILLAYLGVSQFKKIKFLSMSMAFRVIGLFAIAWFLFNQFSLVEDNAPVIVSSHVKKSRPDIILVTVDSLRSDVALETFGTIGLGLKNFLGAADKKTNVITPLAQTHGALLSLLSGKTPTENQVRTNLSYNGVLTDKIMDHSPLKNLVEMGYKVTIIRDNAEYAWFDISQFPSENISPDFSFENLVMSTIYKSRIMYGLFANALGYMILPELKTNSAFNFAYRAADFSKMVSQKLEEIKNDPTPHIVLIHSCSLHWPGAYPFPYYPQKDFPKDGLAPFSYAGKFQAFKKSRITWDQWHERTQFNSGIYNLGVNYTIDHFLNPVFDLFQRNRYAQDSVLVLLSDHGEDLWNDKNPYPLSRPVQHGSNLLFGAQSEKSFLRIQAPPEFPIHLEKNLSLAHLLDRVVDGIDHRTEKTFANSSQTMDSRENIDSNEFIYSETGLWPLASFKGQFISVPTVDLAPLFTLFPDGKHVVINQSKLNEIVVQKQRSLYFRDFRYTLFPTKQGWKDYICNVKTDTDCISKVEDPDLLGKFRTKMMPYLKADVENKYILPDVCGPFSKTTTLFSWPDIKEFSWPYFFQALMCIEGDFNWEAGFEILRKIEKNRRNLSISILEEMDSRYLRWCNQTTLFAQSDYSDLFMPFLQRLEKKYLTVDKRLVQDELSCLAKQNRISNEIALRSRKNKNVEAESTEERTGKRIEKGREKNRAYLLPNWEASRIKAVEDLAKAISISPLQYLNTFKFLFKIEIQYSMNEEWETYLLYLLDHTNQWDLAKKNTLYRTLLSDDELLTLPIYEYIQWQINTQWPRKKNISYSSQIDKYCVLNLKNVGRKEKMNCLRGIIDSYEK